MKRRCIVLALALVAVASCSSSDDGDPAGARPAAGGPSTPESTTVPAGGSPAAAPSTTTTTPISIDYMSGGDVVNTLPLLQAFTKDYFTAEGLDVNVLPPINNSGQQIAALISGDVDIIATGPTAAINAVANGRDVVAVAAINHRSNSVLRLSDDAVAKLAKQGVTPKSPIADRVAALKGLTIAAPGAGSITDAFVRLTLKQYGVDPERDVTLQPVADGASAIAAMRAGQADGSVTSTASDTGEPWIRYAQGDVPMFNNVEFSAIVTTRSFLDRNPEAVDRFLRAMWRGWQDIDRDPASVRAGVKAKYFEKQDQALYDWSVDDALAIFEGGLVPQKSAYEALLAAFNSVSEQQYDVTFEQVYDTTHVEATKP